MSVRVVLAVPLTAPSVQGPRISSPNAMSQAATRLLDRLERLEISVGEAKILRLSSFARRRITTRSLAKLESLEALEALEATGRDDK